MSDENNNLSELLVNAGFNIDETMTKDNSNVASKYGIPLGDGQYAGVPIPILSYRFRVIYSTATNPIDLGRPLYEQDLSLTRDTCYYRVNMAQNRVEFGIRHNTSTGMTTFLDICQHGLEWIRLEGLDGSDNVKVVHTIHGNSVEIIDHRVDYDYDKSSSALVHHFVGRCHDIEVS